MKQWYALYVSPYSYDKFYNGQIQKDSFECFMMLIEVMKRLPSLIMVQILWGCLYLISYSIYFRKMYCRRCVWTEIPPMYEMIK